jgi:hypothetical protein
VGEEAGRLYHLLQNLVSVLPLNFVNFNSSSSKINNAVTSLASTSFFTKSVNTSLWHFILGHPSDVPLKMLSSVIPQISYESNKLCSICPLAKQNRLPFPHSFSGSKQPFDLIHYDIWGPFVVKSVSGSLYFLIIEDDRTRFTWIHTLQHKSQTRNHIQNFFNMVETHFNSKIKSLRSDNGVEFNMSDFYASKGVLH